MQSAFRAAVYGLAGMELLRGPLEPVARLVGVPPGTPHVVIHWGHPFFMSFVLLVMGSTVAVQGWQIRTSSDGAAVSKARSQHPKLALAMTLFFAIGAFGGMGSIIEQGKPLLSRCATCTCAQRLPLIRGSHCSL